MSDDDWDIIQQSNSAENSTSPNRKKHKADKIQALKNWELNGIDTLNPGTYIDREELVDMTVGRTKVDKFVVVASPPGSGKTSLLQLIKKRIVAEKQSSSASKIHGHMLRPAVPPDDLFIWVKEKTGVDFMNNKLDVDYNETWKTEPPSEVWLLFDDAQRLYGNNYTSFWEHVTKNKHMIREDFGTTNIFIIVFATYYLATDSSSPACFEVEARITHDQLLLSHEEAKSIYKRRLPSPYRQWNAYFQELNLLTNGHAAGFTIGLNVIADLSNDVSVRSKGEQATEQQAVHRLLEETPLSGWKRCFPAKAINAMYKDAIMNIITRGYTSEGNVEDPSDSFNDLVKVGILKRSGKFTSPVAQQFFYNALFPRRPSTERAPETIDGIVVETIKRLSALRLRYARQPHPETGKLQSPKEAVYQQLFHEAFASLLPVSYRIIPEFGSKATICGKPVAGEVDFFIRNGHSWAVELLRDGSRVTKHLGRIEGKYRNVHAEAWLVVDCRMIGGRPPQRKQELCTLVFSDDFTTCECFMRLEDPYQITLSN